MPEYKTERNKDGYYTILEDGKPKGDFEILNDARLTVKWLNEKQATIDAQNERAKKNNERNSELEAQVQELEKLNSHLENMLAELFQHFGLTDKILKRVHEHETLSPPVREIKVLADDDPAPGLD